MKNSVLDYPLLFGALLCGGHLVDRAWLEQAKELHGDTGYLLEPHWKLKGAMKKPMELHMTEEFMAKWEEIAILIAEAKGDRLRKAEFTGDVSLQSRWTVVKRHEDVRQEKKAIILCRDAEQAKELSEKQAALKAKEQELKEIVKKLAETKPQPLSLMGNRLQLHSTRKKLRNGRPVSPEEFINIFLSMCHLAR